MKESILKHNKVWAFTTYFTEGFPYTIIRTVSSVFFRDQKVSLENIGLTSLFGLPWVLKFLWAPLLDNFGTKRKWLLAMQTAITLIMLLAAIFSPFSNGVIIIAVLFFIGSILAATHDTAIDGYYMEALDSKGQSEFLGYRVMAYRIAMMTGTGVIVTVSAFAGWFAAFMLASLIMLLFLTFHFFFLKEPEKTKLPFKKLIKQAFKPGVLLYVTLTATVILSFRRFLKSNYYTDLGKTLPLLTKLNFSRWIAVFLLLSLIILILLKNKIKNSLLKHKKSSYAQAFLTFVDREKIELILVFIIFLRAGEFMLTTMISPFIVDLGIKVHYGWISAGIGLPASIIGALAGGKIIAKYGMKKTFFPFILFQNSTNILYMFLALHLSSFVALNTNATSPVSPGAFNIGLVALVHGIEQFSGGLGTAVLMTYLMQLCKAEFKASHYAIGSGLMSLSGLFAGVSSGFLAGWLGYGILFGISFLMAAPALIVIPFLPVKSD